MVYLEKEDVHNGCFGSGSEENSISHVFANAVYCFLHSLWDCVLGYFSVVYAYGILFKYGWAC